MLILYKGHILSKRGAIIDDLFVIIAGDINAVLIGLISKEQTEQLVNEYMDELAFLAARRAIAWEQRPAKDFVRAVNLALMAGAFVAARNLAQEGTDHYPHHAELRKMAYVLAPPTVRVGEGPRTTTWKADREWLKTHWDVYRGQWVALLNGQLLGVADSFDALIAQVGDTRNTDILVTPIW